MYEQVHAIYSDKYSIQQTILNKNNLNKKKNFEDLLYTLQYKTMQQYKKILNSKHDMASKKKSQLKVVLFLINS